MFVQLYTNFPLNKRNYTRVRPTRSYIQYYAYEMYIARAMTIGYDAIAMLSNSSVSTCQLLYMNTFAFHSTRLPLTTQIVYSFFAMGKLYYYYR